MKNRLVSYKTQIINFLVYSVLVLSYSCKSSSSRIKAQTRKSDVIFNQTDLDNFYKRNRKNFENIRYLGNKVDYKNLTKSVLKIAKYENGLEIGNGSGFFIDETGFFITTRHGFDDCLKLQGIELKEFHSQIVECSQIKVKNSIVDFKVSYKNQDYPAKIVSYAQDYKFREVFKGRWSNVKDKSAIKFALANDFIVGKIDPTDKVQIEPIVTNSYQGIQKLSKELESADLAYYGERMFVVGYTGSVRKVYGGSITRHVKCKDTDEKCSHNYPVAYLSFAEDAENLHEIWKEEDGFYNFEYDQRPIHNILLRAEPGMSGGPLFDHEGFNKGMIVSSGPSSTTFVSWMKILNVFFTKERVKNPMLTLVHKDYKLVNGEEVVNSTPLYLKSD